MQGIISDVKGRLPLYTNDWQEGLNCNIRRGHQTPSLH